MRRGLVIVAAWIVAVSAAVAHAQALPQEIPPELRPWVPPEMQVQGNRSSDAVLRWYADRISGETPEIRVVSLPLWVYRVTMLAWSLWLAARLVRAAAWGWRAFGAGGFWQPLRTRRPGTVSAEGAGP